MLLGIDGDGMSANSVWQYAFSSKVLVGLVLVFDLSYMVSAVIQCCRSVWVEVRPGI